MAKRVRVQKKAKVVKNDRKSLNSWHKFADYKPSQLPKGAKGVKLSGEWTKLFSGREECVARDRLWEVFVGSIGEEEVNGQGHGDAAAVPGLSQGRTKRGHGYRVVDAGYD